ncbi:GtrA family protein [Tengunoibacter tsumagoiensis]|uniref:GtrA/DPMS transmembrane domain-containing protein n=1 Tax=Tengunoibacter tsumagoiensis TaxID=2014871 RepID=A0A401ZXW2_9CHLR|nr:GtrA family protein [Tengunoibacter tsumagoiensis]GCE11696.1 hypothetical protein KTT_15550 [Tengunoibacter tsumagoiensis]
MEQSTVPSESHGILEPAISVEELMGPASRIPSYSPTPWAIVNSILDIVDKVSGGRAGWVQRFFSFAFFGGMAAVVNLIVFYIGYYVVLPSDGSTVHYVVAYLFAYELSVLANFIPNDYFTFKQLRSSGDRPWIVRNARFHAGSITGGVLTFVLSYAFKSFLGVPAIIAQAIALILVLFYNFAFHHLFTYRHKKAVSVEEALIETVKEAVTGEMPVVDSVHTAL